MKPSHIALIALISIPGVLLGADQRWALTANGQSGPNQGVEDRLVDEISSRLAGRPGIAIVDRASVDKVLKEQNFQSSDRSSPETAARIGKLLGVAELLVIRIYDFTYSTHDEQSGGTKRTTASISLRASAKMIDVESGVIRSQPTAVFEESVPLSESQQATPGGGVPIPMIGRAGIAAGVAGGILRGGAKPAKATGADPKVVADSERAKAIGAVATDLAAKLAPGTSSSSGSPQAESALVAGIVDGAVYINRGSAAGVRQGSRFQVVRQVSLGIPDPETGKMMTQKQRICTLTVNVVADSNASGSCDGGVPQAKDVAEPIR